jgi:micrococcal nuclease
MTVEPWSPQKIPNIADTRSAFVRRRQHRRAERIAQSTVLAVTILSGVIATTIFSPVRFFLPVPAFGEFRLCGGLNRYNCVIDGDTIRYQGVKIRLADIDTAEITAPKCRYEADLGHKAKRRLLELINAGPIEVVSTGGPDVDRYGRKLRLILQNGRSLGDVLVAEGLARRWNGARRPWC